jgi:hypothetical protein
LITANDEKVSLDETAKTIRHAAAAREREPQAGKWLPAGIMAPRERRW